MEEYNLCRLTAFGVSGAEKLNSKISVPAQENNIKGEGNKYVDQENLPEVEIASQPKKSANKAESVNLNVNIIQNANSETPKIETCINCVQVKQDKGVNELAKQGYNAVNTIKTKQDNAEIKGENLVVKPTVVTIFPAEIRAGFEECKSEIEKLYVQVLKINALFKPSLVDSVGDMLAYIGSIANRSGKGNEYLSAFGINPQKFGGKYESIEYLPYAIRVGVWFDKNKGTQFAVFILNGLIRALFELLKGESEECTLANVKDSISGIMSYLKNEGIDADF